MAAGVVDDIDSKLALANIIVVEGGTSTKAAFVIDQLLNSGLD
jgi:hypothetical protein